MATAAQAYRFASTQCHFFSLPQLRESSVASGPLRMHGSMSKHSLPDVRIQIGLDQVIKAVNGRPKQGKYAARIGKHYHSFKKNNPYKVETSSQICRAKVVNEGEDPYRILENGQKVYLDELDVLTVLDPPSFLIPTNANTYDQASYLWKKIDDIPEERRHHLLDLLTPTHISNMWKISGDMFKNSNVSQPDSQNFLLGLERQYPLKPVNWIGKLTDASWPPLEWFYGRFSKGFYLGTDGSMYGRVIIGIWLLENITSFMLPLYYKVRDVRKVVATEEPCRIGFEYSDGKSHISDVPIDFPKPAKHPWPLSDGMFDYIRPAGPGVFVGQMWQEGKEHEKIPKRRANFVMIKDYLRNKSK